MAISRCDVHADPSRMEIPQHGSLLLVFYEDDMEPMDVPMHWHEKMEYRKTEHIKNSVVPHCFRNGLRQNAYHQRKKNLLRHLHHGYLHGGFLCGIASCTDTCQYDVSVVADHRKVCIPPHPLRYALFCVWKR